MFPRAQFLLLLNKLAASSKMWRAAKHVFVLSAQRLRRRRERTLNTMEWSGLRSLGLKSLRRWRKSADCSSCTCVRWRCRYRPLRVTAATITRKSETFHPHQELKECHWFRCTPNIFSLMTKQDLKEIRLSVNSDLFVHWYFQLAITGWIDSSVSFHSSVSDQNQRDKH